MRRKSVDTVELWPPRGARKRSMRLRNRAKSGIDIANGNNKAPSSRAGGNSNSAKTASTAMPMPVHLRLRASRTGSALIIR